MKKIVLWIISVLTVFSLAGCVEKEVEKPEENHENAQDNKEIFYIINDNYMGSYVNDTWYSSRVFDGTQSKGWAYNDLLGNDTLTLYSEQFLNSGESLNKKEINEVIVSLSDSGIGDFLCSDSVGEYGYSEDREKLREEFRTYTKTFEENEYDSIFELPTLLIGNLENLKTNYSNTWISFKENYSVVTNAPYELKFANKVEPGEISEEVKKYIIDYAVNHNVSSDIEYDCSLAQKADINHDGTIDTVLVLNSRDTSTLDWDSKVAFEIENGSFCLVLAELGNGEIITIFEESLEKGRDEEFYLSYHYGGNRIVDMIVVDLNNDNLYEVFVKNSDGESFITASINGKYKVVAYNTHVN